MAERFTQSNMARFVRTGNSALYSSDGDWSSHLAIFFARIIYCYGIHLSESLGGGAMDTCSAGIQQVSSTYRAT